MKVEITRHAEQRMRERLGIKKKSIKRIAQKAFDEGIRHSETKWNLNKWVTSVYFRNGNANNVRIFGNILYIFHNETLITFYYVPSSLTKNLESMVKRGD